MTQRNITILCSIIIIFLDQATKQTILFKFALYYLPIKLSQFCNLMCTWNTGFAFSCLHIFTFYYKIILFGILASHYIFIFHIKKIFSLFDGFIIGGVLSNILDRFLYGAVFDFIDLHICDFHYPTFNVADTFIVLFILIRLFKNEFFYIIWEIYKIS